MIPEFLNEELEALRAKGHSVDVVEADGWFNTVFSNYPLPPGYSKTTTQLLVKLPISYKNGKPDMFWTDEDVVLRNGTVPKSAEVIEETLGKKWRRFSWHAQKWNPATDNLETYLEFVNTRLSKAV